MKDMKKLISLWLALCLVISMVPVQTFAQEEIVAETEQTLATETPDAEATLPEGTEVTEISEMECLPEAPAEMEETAVSQETLAETAESETITVTDVAFADETVTSGVCGSNWGDNVVWEYDSVTATITISGTGEMDSYLDAYGDWTMSEDVPPWSHFFNQIQHFVIKPGVTNIGGYAFQHCPNLISVTIPTTVKKIQQYVLGGASYVGGPKDPSVKEIHYGGTQEAWKQLLATTNSLSNGKLFSESIIIYYESDGYKPLTWTLENGVLTINRVGPMFNYGQKQAPWYGQYINKIVLADTLTSIGDYAFYDCTYLTEIVIPSGITRIGKCAFQNCGDAFKTISLPDSLITIDNYAFHKTCLTGIVIPDSVTTIGTYAFGNCKYLEDVTLPRGLQKLESRVFFNDGSLKEIRIPDTVTTIDDQAFYGCTNLRSVIIPACVTTIGDLAFEECTSLTTIHIPDAVTSMGNSAFAGCTSLKEVTLGSGLSTLGHSLFSECENLQKVTIKNGLQCIGDSMFSYCPKLPTITIPETVTVIGSNAFSNCTGLVTISLPASIQSVESYAFNKCSALKMVFYGGSKEQWSAVEINYGNTPLQEAVIYFGEGALSITGMTIDRKYRNFYLFLSDPHIYQMNSPESGSYVELSELMAFDSTAVADSITWSSSDESVLKVISGGTAPKFEAVALGMAVVSATNSQGETTGFPVTVLQPNVLEFTSIHGTKQFYAEGGFYSEESDFSDCVEIYLRLENKKSKGNPCTPADPADSVLSTDPIAITAEISGTDLSFSRDAYQNIYTAVYDPIGYETSLADLLMLYPVDPDNLVPGNSYTVQITMESDSFLSTVTETCSFTISDATQAKISGHIDFATHDTGYIVSKHNHYGQNMAELKKDPEYLWSKWTSLDLENYYEVVLADILIEILNIQQEKGFSIMPKLLKEWGGYYKTISGGIDKVLKQEYEKIYDFSETKIEKIFKLNKYDTATANHGIKDAGYRLVMDYIANPNNASKIHEVFQKIDRTKQIYGMVSIATDFRKELNAWGNTICMMNAFHQADEELKQVLVTVSGMIPADADPKLLEALQDYINYDYNVQGQAAEICETFLKTAQKLSFDTFKSVWGKSVDKFISGKLLSYIGDIRLIGGTTVAATTLFGAITTGVSIGLSLSDILCDTEDKAAEMGKIIAMSDYAPYFIEALEIYEDRMIDRKTEESVDMFETAVRLHKAVQSYIMQHTHDLLILKGESLIQIIRGNAEYYEVASDVLAHKRNIDWMNCCDAVDMSSHAQVKTRIIAICCPVDAYVYNAAGEEVVRILGDQLEYAADGISVYIRDREKFVAVPANQEYSVKIIATDAGTMDYLVLEYDENLERERIVKQEGLELEQNRVFTGEVPENTVGSPDIYDLSVQESVPSVPMHRMYDPNSGEHFYTGSTVERDFLVKAGWHYEGVGFNFPQEGKPVYRLYEPVHGEHLYTMDQAEKAKLISWGWNDEGVAFNSAGEDEVPQYRLHNPNAKRGGYHFTGSEAERDFLISIGWINEGIGWYSCVD